MVFSVLVFAFASHLLAVFYARRFVWSDLHPVTLCQKSLSYFASGMEVLKPILIFITLRHGLLMNTKQIYGATVLLAIPQLYRLPRFRQVRVFLGPISPIISTQNAPKDRSILSTVFFLISFLAFVVLRPDNDQVLEVFLRPTAPIYKFLGTAQTRRKLHGSLALCNTILAFLVVLASCVSSVKPVFPDVVLLTSE